MMEAVSVPASPLDGKTIRYVKLSPPSPHDGRPDKSRLHLHCTDGTVVEIQGGGDDVDDWVGMEILTADELRDRDAKQREHELAQAERDRARAAWLALTCDQRAAERDRRRQEKPDTLLMGDAMAEWVDSMLERQSHLYDQPERTVRRRCSACGERECPNAPTRVIPAQQGILGGSWTAVL